MDYLDLEQVNFTKITIKLDLLPSLFNYDYDCKTHSLLFLCEHKENIKIVTNNFDS